MTDTGRFPGEGQPENAGALPGHPLPADAAAPADTGTPAPYTFADSADAADEDDLLLMPGAQGAWMEQPPVQGGTHETGGRDTGSVEYHGVRTAPAAAAAASAQPRRPLHMGPPVPEPNTGVVRSLADRGPAAPQQPVGAPVVPQQAQATAPGPEYLDVPGAEAQSTPGAWEAEPAPVAFVPPQATGHEIIAEEAAPAAPTVDSPSTDQAAPAAPAGGLDLGGMRAFVEPAQPAQPAPVAAPAEPVGAVSAPEAAVAAVAAEPVPAADAPQAAQVTQDEPVAVPVPAEAQPAAAPAESVAVQSAPEPVAEAPQEAPAAVESVPAPVQEAQPAAVAAPVDGAAQVPAPALEPEAAPVPVPVQEVQAAVEAAPEPVVEVPAAPAAPAEEAQVQQAAAAPVPAPAPAPVPETQTPAPAVSQPVAEAAPQEVQAAEEPPAPEPVAEPVQEAPVQEAPIAAAAAVEAQAPVLVQEADGAGTPVDGGSPAPAPETAVDNAASVPTQEAPPAAVSAPDSEVPVPVQEAAPVAAAPEGVSPAPVQEATAGIVPDSEVPVAAPAEPQDVPAEAVAPEPPAVTVDEVQPVPEQQAEAVTPEAQPVPEEQSAAAAPVPVPVPDEQPQQAAPVETPAHIRLVPDESEPAVAPDAAAEPQEPAPAPEPLGPPAVGYGEAERAAVHRVMRDRRDIRKGFRTDPIPHEVLLRVLEAAHTAPSVGHSQPWDFVVIRSEETRRTMHELAARQREAYAKSLPKARAKQFKELKIEAILDTPVNIVVTADPTRGGRHTLGRHTQPQMAPYSSALAVENLWLAARAEGLGVGWVSFFDEREMVRTLGLPEHLEVVAYLCIGYVDEFPDEPELMQAGWSKRRPLSWVVHEEEYGRRALPGEDPHDLLAETLRGIRPLDAKALGEAWERQKRMTKPSGALGMLEIISAQLCGLSRKCPPPIPEPAAVAIFAGDHGVHAQGVTAWPQEVTSQMVANFLGGGAVCNAFANQVGAEVCVVDVGVAGELPSTPGLLPRKIRPGTADFTAGPAMSREEALRAIEVGIETARDLVTAGNKALLTGEMGIANTTVSAALIAIYTGADPAEITGRGTGINDEMHARKIDVVRRALELHQPDPNDPIGVLAAVGGLEHAALVGLILGGASLRTPVILDGVSAGAAALVARAIAPEALAACIAGHRSAEPGHVAALTKLGLRPLVDLDLRLGEGTGALLALPVVQSAARAMHEVATFDTAGVTEKS